MGQQYHTAPNSEKRLTVAICGAGRIGAMWDSPTDQHVLTHAHAFSKHPRTTLLGFVESDGARGTEAAERWKTNHFTDLDALYAAGSPDIVVIATPDETHIEMVERIVARGSKLIICEKPIATSHTALDRVKMLQSTVPIIINYSRRFDTTVQDLARSISVGEFGDIITAVGIYTNGFLHNGSHLIDLMRVFFGEMLQGRILNTGVDNARNAMNVAAHLSFERCPQVYLGYGDGRNYTVFELEMYTSKKYFRFFNSGFGLEIRDAIPSPLYAGFTILGERQTTVTGLSFALPALAEHAVAVVAEREEPNSTLASALRTEETCLTLLDDAYE